MRHKIAAAWIYSVLMIGLMMGLMIGRPLPAHAGVGDLCRHALSALLPSLSKPTTEINLSQAYRDFNPSAALPAEHYIQPNQRPLAEYNRALYSKDYKLEYGLTPGAVVVDLGAGYAVAMHELTTQKNVTAIAINTQDHSKFWSQRPHLGKLDYRVGWAEEILPTLPSSSVDRVIEVWGAIAYSPLKNKIIEEAYRILRPGGELRFFLPSSFKAPADVVVKGKTINFGDWLEQAFPDLVSILSVKDPNYNSGRVVVIKKPLSGPQTLNLGLRIRLIDEIRGGALAAPVLYELDPLQERP